MGNPYFNPQPYYPGGTPQLSDGVARPGGQPTFAFGPNPYAGQPHAQWGPGVGQTGAVLANAAPQPNSGYGAGAGPQAGLIGGQTMSDNQYLAQALKALGQQRQGNAEGLGGNLGAAALLTLANQIPDQVGPLRHKMLDPTMPQISPGMSLGDVSSALPDASY